jgi:hypothetical protein
MGYIAHDLACISISTKTGKARVEAWRDALPDRFRGYALGPVCAINGYCFYVLTPDGSKEGWEDSNAMDKVRAEFLALSEDDCVHVRFGGDFGYETPGGAEVKTGTGEEAADAFADALWR